jgi:hypothetical protein
METDVARADFLVADAVLQNRSLGFALPNNREKRRESRRKGHFRVPQCGIESVYFQWISDMVPYLR